MIKDLDRPKSLYGFFGLSGSVLSPYHPDSRAIRNSVMAKARIMSFTGNGVAVETWDNSNVFTGTFIETCFIQQSSITPSAIISDVYSGVNAALESDTGSTFALSDYDLVFPQTITLPLAPSSYQTIVSQTGTAAPAVSGSLSPMSTYAAGTTFTWARTGVGVYTLTASAAVFNTSGKTGVFVGSLNNLNASCKTVVTSSTVITITTAIGSLLGLGLLGLTATNTDALLAQTMIYVQTYA